MTAAPSCQQVTGVIKLGNLDTYTGENVYENGHPFNCDGGQFTTDVDRNQKYNALQERACERVQVMLLTDHLNRVSIVMNYF